MTAIGMILEFSGIVGNLRCQPTDLNDEGIRIPYRVLGLLVFLHHGRTRLGRR